MKCIVCKFNVELDDVTLQAGTNGMRVICSRCYYTATGTYKQIGKHLKSEIDEVLRDAAT